MNEGKLMYLDVVSTRNINRITRSRFRGPKRIFTATSSFSDFLFLKKSELKVYCHFETLE